MKTEQKAKDNVETKQNAINAPDVPKANADLKLDTMTMLEKEHGGKLMRAVNLPDEYSELKQWIHCMKFGGLNVLAIDRGDRVTIKWYTVDSIISISVRLPTSESDDGYLGGGASSRAPRTGETWTRGNDLADGPYSKETWNRILADAAGWSAEPLQIEV